MCDLTDDGDPPGHFLIRAAVNPMGIAIICSQKCYEDLASLRKGLM